MRNGLTKMDTKLLRTLVFEGGHLTESELGKRLKLSQTTINYKLKKLEEMGAIIGYRYRLNPFKCSRKSMAWWLITIERQGDADRIRQFLMSRSNVQSVSIISGEYDILAKVFYEDLNDLHDCILETEKALRYDIRQIDSLIVTKPIKLHQVRFKPEDTIPLDMDDIDREILISILENPNATIKEMAEGIGIHRNTAGSRWRKLWNKNVVLKKSVIVSPRFYEDIGIRFRAVLLIDSEGGTTNKVGDELAALPEIHELTAISTQHNLLAIVRASDSRSYFKMLKEIIQKKEVRKTKTMLIFDSIEKTACF